MGVLAKNRVERVFHFAPLHYLPFIARAKAILSKPSLAKQGFPPTHLRSMSSNQDVQRGFGAFAHLTLADSPPILNAKLSAGFPHIAIVVPADAIDKIEFSLCRYNVAMARFLKKNGKGGFIESAVNGRYYDDLQIPIAKTDPDKLAMLAKFVGTSTMIEVLIPGDLSLPDSTQVFCYSDADLSLAQNVVAQTGVSWNPTRVAPAGTYPNTKKYSDAVDHFIATALADPNWRGNGLEFDRV